MPMPKRVTPLITREIRLPEDLDAKLQVHLYSDLEKRIPYGGLSRFFEKLLRDYFAGLNGGSK